jgi:hypothetical protein
MIEILYTIMAIIIPSEILYYRIQESLKEDEWSYIPDEFVRLVCYTIIGFLFTIFMVAVKITHIW